METISSELPTNALFKPAFDNCAAITEVTNAVPLTFIPEYVAIFIALSKSSPFHIDVANVIAAVIAIAVPSSSIRIDCMIC